MQGIVSLLLQDPPYRGGNMSQLVRVKVMMVVLVMVVMMVLVMVVMLQMLMD